jgi:hypothetical protein
VRKNYIRHRIYLKITGTNKFLPQKWSKFLRQILVIVTKISDPDQMIKMNSI